MGPGGVYDGSGGGGGLGPGGVYDGSGGQPIYINEDRIDAISIQSNIFQKNVFQLFFFNFFHFFPFFQRFTEKSRAVDCTEVRFASYYYGSNKSTGKEIGKTHLC